MSSKFDTVVEFNQGVIKIVGDLDNELAGEALKAAFDSLLNQGQKTIVLDFGQVNLINSYGIGKVLLCYQRMQVADGILKVRSVQGFVQDAFKLLMLEGLFPVDNYGAEPEIQSAAG